MQVWGGDKGEEDKANIAAAGRERQEGNPVLYYGYVG